MTEPITPAGLRCRRKALGLTRAELGAIVDAPESAIRSWEIGKGAPRDPLSVHMLLGNLEDAALDCVDDLTAPADDEIEDVRASMAAADPTDFTALGDFQAQISDLQQQIDALEEEWMEAAEKLGE